MEGPKERPYQGKSLPLLVEAFQSNLPSRYRELGRPDPFIMGPIITVEDQIRFPVTTEVATRLSRHFLNFDTVRVRAEEHMSRRGSTTKVVQSTEEVEEFGGKYNAVTRTELGPSLGGHSIPLARLTDYERVGKGELNVSRRTMFKPLTTVGLTGSRRVGASYEQKPFVIEVTRYETPDGLVDVYHFVDVLPGQSSVNIATMPYMPHFEKELADSLGLKYPPVPEPQR